MTLEEIVDIYSLAWSEVDAAKREQFLAQTLLSDVIYCDPTVSLSGREALSDYIAAVLTKHPGSRVQLTSAIDRHHDIARFSWHLVQADGAALPEGLDVVTIDKATGKLKSILGFFGPLKRR